MGFLLNRLVPERHVGSNFVPIVVRQTCLYILSFKYKLLSSSIIIIDSRINSFDNLLCINSRYFVSQLFIAVMPSHSQSMKVEEDSINF